MKLILLKCPLVLLPILKVLHTLPVKHPIVPITLVLSMPSVPIQHSVSTLNTIPELTLIPAAVRPPERAPPISLPLHELSFVEIRLLSCPLIQSSSIFLIKFEFTKIVVAT